MVEPLLLSGSDASGGAGDGERNEIGFLLSKNGASVIALGTSGFESVMSFAPADGAFIPLKKVVALEHDISTFVNLSDGWRFVTFGGLRGDASAELKQASTDEVRVA